MKKIKAFLLGVVSVFAFSSFAATYYVSKENGKDTNDGSALSPFASVAKALSVAENGAEIIVGDGTYTNPSDDGLLVTNSVTLRSVSGPEKTILRGSGKGRVIWIKKSGAIVSGFTVIGGVPNGTTDPARSGFGAYVTSGTLTNSVIRNNSAAGFGALAIGSDGKVTCSVISNNTQTAGWGRGGGVHMTGGILEHSLVAGNSSAGNTDQSPRSGGGVLVNGGSCTIRNCTIVRNKARRGAGIAIGHQNNVAKITDTICYGNEVPSGYEDNTTYGPNFWYTGSPNLTQITNLCTSLKNSAVIGVVMDGDTPAEDQTILSNGPEFADMENGDYSLGFGSRCLDFAWGGPTVSKDVVGNARVYGERMDIGAIEEQGKITANELRVLVDNGIFDGVAVTPAFGDHSGISGAITFTAPVTNCYENIDTKATYHTITGWECEVIRRNGTIVKTSGEGTTAVIEHVEGTNLRFTWKSTCYHLVSLSSSHPDIGIVSGSGYYVEGTTATLTAEVRDDSPMPRASFKKWNDSSLLAEEEIFSPRVSYVVDAPITLTAYFPVSFYVDEDKGSNDYNGFSWNSPFKDVWYAVEKSQPYDEITVNDGEYENPSDFSYGMQIVHSVTMRSVNGPEKTILKGGGTGRVIWIKNSGALVSGFSFIGGAGSNIFDVGTGFGAYVTSGTLTNSVVRNNSSTGYGALGIGSGGKVTCSVISNNTQTAAWGRGGGVHMAGGILEHSLVAGNSSAGNTEQAPRSGGGVLVNGGSCTIRNCTIVRNKARRGAGIAIGHQGNVAKITDTICYGNEVLPGYEDNTIYGPDFWHTGSPNLTQITNFCIAATNGVVIGTVMDGDKIAEDQRKFMSGPGFRNIGRGDYRLVTGSPCIDSAWGKPTVTKDAAGNPRIIGRAMDIGAYECLRLPGTKVLVR